MQEQWKVLIGRDDEKLMNLLFQKIKDRNIITIMDAGSGDTSLSSLLSHFKEANIDAITYPKDSIKTKEVLKNIVSQRYQLFEYDLAQTDITKQYDLVLSHLTLGNAIHYNTDSKELFRNILTFDSRFFVFVDVKENPTLNFEYMKTYIQENHMRLLSVIEMTKTKPEIATIQGTKFVEKTYVGYLVEKNVNRTDQWDLK